jgi:hypothetical protein
MDKIFSSFPWSFQTNSGAHPAAYSLVPEALLVVGGQTGHEADHSPPSKETVALNVHCRMHFHAWGLIKHTASFEAKYW